jgi:Zn-dependent protease with chaperone function
LTAVGVVVAPLVQPKSNRNQELQADAFAVDLLRAMGYSKPGGELAASLALIQKIIGAGNGGGFFSAHPPFDERIARLRGK